MPLGYSLKTSFSSCVSACPTTSEVELFRCLKMAFSSMPDYSAGEIHGHKRQVLYTEANGWFTKKPRCELGDLAIIAFSKKKGQGRLVIIQNKVSRDSKRGLGSNCRGIYASLVQYELLRERPFFCFASGPYSGRRNGLIKFSPYSSVCQYGLFYKDRFGNVDMSSITASEFALPAKTILRFPIRSRHPVAKIEFNKKFETFASRSATGDFVAAENLIDFGNLLEDMYIGRPINVYQKKVIEDMLMLKMASDDADMSYEARRAIDDFMGTEFIEDTNVSYLNGENENNKAEWDCLLNVCRSLVLINVDPCRLNETFD